MTHDMVGTTIVLVVGGVLIFALVLLIICVWLDSIGGKKG
jgi:hypothetical protein